MNPFREPLDLNYKINDLILQGETALKSSPLIEYILPRAQSLEDLRNPNREKQYYRYVHQANFTNFPLIALTNVLGLANKGEAKIDLPPQMQSLIEYATMQNTPLSKIQDDLIKDVFFFGSALIRVVIPNDMSTLRPPRLDVISAKNVIDFHTTIIGDQEMYDWILLDASRFIFDESTKRHDRVNMYELLALDENGTYYEAIFDESTWKTFDIKHPDGSSDGVISLVYPQFNSTLSFVPVVGVNVRSVEFRFEPAYVQDLIDLSLSIFSLDADLRIGLYFQSNPFLAIYGSNLDSKEVVQGVYAVNIFEDTSAKAEFVSPSCAGMNLQHEKLREMRKDAANKVYDIIQQAGAASGDALALRINSGTTSLVNFIQTIGLAIKKALQEVAIIIGQNPESVDYEPYVGFSQVQLGEQIKQTALGGNDDKDFSKDDGEKKLEKNEENEEEKREVE